MTLLHGQFALLFITIKVKLEYDTSRERLYDRMIVRRHVPNVITRLRALGP